MCFILPIDVAGKGGKWTKNKKLLMPHRSIPRSLDICLFFELLQLKVNIVSSLSRFHSEPSSLHSWLFLQDSPPFSPLASQLCLHFARNLRLRLRHFHSRAFCFVSASVAVCVSRSDFHSNPTQLWATNFSIHT